MYDITAIGFQSHVQEDIDMWWMNILPTHPHYPSNASERISPQSDQVGQISNLKERHRQS